MRPNRNPRKIFQRCCASTCLGKTDSWKLLKKDVGASSLRTIPTTMISRLKWWKRQSVLSSVSIGTIVSLKMAGIPALSDIWNLFCAKIYRKPKQETVVI